MSIRLLVPVAAAAVLVAGCSSSPPAAPATASPPPAVTSATPTRSLAPKPLQRPRHRHHPLRVTVVGDSLAWTLANGLPDTAGRHGVRIFNAGTVGCGITTLDHYRYFGSTHARMAKCFRWRHTWQHAIRRDDADVVLVAIGRWEITDQRLHGRWTHIGTSGYNAYLADRLEAAYRTAAIHGASVVFATAPYYRRGEQRGGGLWPEDRPARVDTFNRMLRAMAARHGPRARVVDLNRKTAGGRHHYVASVDGVQLRYDGVHFTTAAGRWLAPWLYPQLERAADAARSS